VNGAQSCAWAAAHDAWHEDTVWPATTSRQHESPGPQLSVPEHASAPLAGAGELGVMLGQVVAVTHVYTVAWATQQIWPGSGQVALNPQRTTGPEPPSE
jgi:hypothetical protein